MVMARLEKRTQTIDELMQLLKIEEDSEVDKSFMALQSAIIDIAGPEAAKAIERLAVKKYGLRRTHRRFGHLNFRQRSSPF
jgi:hypothetical protein